MKRCVENRPAIIISAGGTSGAETGLTFQVRKSSENLSIVRYSNGDYYTVSSFSVDWIQNYHWYSVRVKRDDSLLPGNNIFFKVWEQWDEEPAVWQIETKDETLGAGFVGFFDFDSNGESFFSDITVNDENSFSFLGLTELPTNNWSVLFG